jgi:hypothetical protein
LKSEKLVKKFGPLVVLKTGETWSEKQKNLEFLVGFKRDPYFIYGWAKFVLAPRLARNSGENKGKICLVKEIFYFGRASYEMVSSRGLCFFFTQQDASQKVPMAQQRIKLIFRNAH